MPLGTIPAQVSIFDYLGGVSMFFLLGLFLGFTLGFIVASCCVIARERTLDVSRKTILDVSEESARQKVVEEAT